MSTRPGECEWCRLWSAVRFYVRLLDGRSAWVCSECERSIARHRSWQAKEEPSRAGSRA